MVRQIMRHSSQKTLTLLCLASYLNATPAIFAATDPLSPADCSSLYDCRTQVGAILQAAIGSPSNTQQAMDQLFAIARDNGPIGKMAGDLAVRYTFELAAGDEALQRRALLRIIEDPAISMQCFRIATELAVYVADDNLRAVMAAQLNAAWPIGAELSQSARCHPCLEFFVEDGDVRGLKWLEEMIKRDESTRAGGNFFRQYYDKMILHGDCPGLMKLIRESNRTYTKPWALRQAWRYCRDRSAVATAAWQCIEELELRGRDGAAIIMMNECDQIGILEPQGSAAIARVRLVVGQDKKGYQELQRSHGTTIETTAAQNAYRRFYNSRP